MRPTPETDAKVSPCIGFYSCATVPAEFARKLERERDKAREELKEIAEYGTEEINAAVELRQKLASALIERDEAREVIKIVAQDKDKMIEQVIVERNSARKAFETLRSHYARTVSTY